MKKFHCPFCDKPFENAQRRASHITKGHAGKQASAYSALNIMERTAPRIPSLVLVGAKITISSEKARSHATPAMGPLDHVMAAIEQTKGNIAAFDAVIVNQENILRERGLAAEQLKILESTRDRLKGEPVTAANANEILPSMARSA